MDFKALLKSAVRTFAVIASVEIIVASILLAFSKHMASYELVIINALALVIFSVPLISVYIIKPYLDARAKTLTEIRHIASKDPLTQLANRHLVMEHLDRVVAGCTRHHEYCAVLLINLDAFRLVNEQYGYDAGDTVLVEVARRLRATNRTSDVVGRMGNDEFIVLLERLESDIGVTGDRVLKIADKFISMLNMPIKIQSTEVHVNASIGIRMLGFGPINTDMTIREADMAMYRAKEAGGGRAILFDGKMNAMSNRDASQYSHQQMRICS